MTNVYTFEIEASIDAPDERTAFMLLALNLLRNTYSDWEGNNRVIAEFGPSVSGGYIGAVDFTVGVEPIPERNGQP